ncbi:MAG: hypothetical protein H7066_12735, partial [Cytophagaceae bacterium]|nr:hypothetical protein [Gemmatimonadaceae bacterium]
LDLGTLPLRHDLVRFADLLATILPGVTAEAESRGVVVHATIAPAIPTFLGDRERLQEAVTLLLRNAVSHAPTGTSLDLLVEHTAGELRLKLPRVDADPRTPDGALADRIIRASGGRLVTTSGRIALHLPLRRP